MIIDEKASDRVRGLEAACGAKTMQVPYVCEKKKNQISKTRPIKRFLFQIHAFSLQSDELHKRLI